MKKIENNFMVTGFVGRDAEIRQFTNASVATLLTGTQPSGEERRRTHPSVRIYECGSMAQERPHRVIRQAHQGHTPHR